MGWLSERWQDVKDTGQKIEDEVRDVGSKIDDEILQPIRKPISQAIDDLRDWLNPDIPTPSFDTKIGVDLDNRVGTNETIPVAYGLVRTGGIMYPIGVTGATNEFLHLVFILSEGEIDSIVDVYFDDILSTNPRYSGFFSVVLFSGSDTQGASPDLSAAFPDWTANHKGSGLAYAYVKLTYNANAWNGVPRVNFVIKGKKVFDPRTSLTVWSQNPAVILRDYLLNTRYGKGLLLSDIDEASFIEVANYCDDLVIFHLGAGGQMKRWQFDGLLDTERSLLDNLNDMRMTCRMYPVRVADKYRIRIDKDETPVMTLTDKTILGGWSVTDSGMQGHFNRVDVSFVNPLKGYQEDMGRHDSPIFRTEDNGRLLHGKFALPYTTDYYRALNYGELSLKQSRQNMTCSVVASPESLKIEPGDVIAITHATPGWTDKKWRVLSIEHAPDGIGYFSLSEHDSTVYNLDAKIEAPDEPDTDLPDPNIVIAPTNLALESGTIHLLVGTDGTVISRIRAFWTASADIFVVGYETEFKKTVEATWRPGPAASSRSSTEVYISPVDDGVLYDFRVRAINSRSKVSPWVTATGHAVIGKTEPPPDVSNFLVERQSDGTRQYTWTYPSSPPDLAGFEIRFALGTGVLWESMIELQGAEQLAPYIRLFESNQLAAGTYSVGIKAFDTSGNYSVNARYINSTLGDPRVKGQLHIERPRLLGWPGTKTDCFLTYEGVLAALDNGTWQGAPAQWSAFTSWYQSPRTPIKYSHTAIDLGAVYKFTPLISVVVDGNPTITIDHSQDNVTWSGEVAATGLITARYIKAFVSVAASASFAIPVIRDMTILLTAELIEEDLEDVNIALLTGSYRIAVGDVRLPKVKTYVTIKNVEIALQNVGSGWTWELKDKDTVVGPRIVIWNGAVKADAVIDAHIRGI